MHTKLHHSDLRTGALERSVCSVQYGKNIECLRDAEYEEIAVTHTVLMIPILHSFKNKNSALLKEILTQAPLCVHWFSALALLHNCIGITNE